MQDTLLLENVEEELEWEPEVTADHQVRPFAATTPDDSQISEAIMNSFRWRGNIPESVKAEVEDGRVTLRGEVEWDYQRREAAQVGALNGVRGLTNLITLKPKSKASDVQNGVSQALRRNADLDARSIWVTADGGTVHLYGHVHSRHEKQAAEQAAFAAPGVSDVDNQITVIA